MATDADECWSAERMLKKAMRIQAAYVRLRTDDLVNVADGGYIAADIGMSPTDSDGGKPQLHGVLNMDRYFSAVSYGGVAPREGAAEAAEQIRRDAALDEALSCTFPASDPVALDFSFTSLAAVNRARQRASARFTHLVRWAFTENRS